jgi:hypothetical protein
MNHIDYVRQELLKQLNGCEGLVGAMLLGSISAGMDDESSDYDIQLVFTDAALDNHPDYREPKISLCRKTDCWATSLTELENCGRGSPDVRELLHAIFVLDDHGILKQTVENLIHYPPDELGTILSAKLDSYYDGVFRSLKCHRHGFSFGMYQMAARSMEFFVEVLWAANGLVAPFLNRAPYLLHMLANLPLPQDETRRLMEGIAESADEANQIMLLDAMILFMNKVGYQKVLDDWEGVLEREADLHRQPQPG